MSMRLRRAVSSAVIVALAAFGLVVGIAAPASAATAVTVSGHVYLGDNSHSAGAGEVLVTVALEGYLGTSVSTDANGDYSIAVDTTNTRTMSAKFTYQGTASFGNAYYPGVPAPSTFTVYTPTSPNINVTLRPPTAVGGQVLLGPSGVAAPAGSVRVFYKQRTMESADFGPESSVLVDANGTWAIPSLSAGSYAFRYEYLGVDGYQSLPYTFTPFFTPTTLVWGSPVTLPVTTLYPANSIGGKVTLRDGVPAGAGQVRVIWSYLPPGGSTRVVDSSRPVFTDSTGSYIITGLQPGYYGLRFEWVGTPSAIYAASTWAYDDVLLTADDTNEFGLQNALRPTWAVTGHVDLATSGHSAGLGQVKVSARCTFCYDGPVATTLTDANGAWALGLTSGEDYYFTFEYVGTGASYLEWYLGANYDGPVVNPIDTHRLSISSDKDLGNVVMGRGPTISGTVTDTGGHPLAGQIVHAHGSPQSSIPTTQTIVDFTTTTLADGTYRFKGLLDDYSYTVSFGGDYDGVYAHEVWDDAGDFYFYNVIRFGAGDTSTFDGVDAELEHPASISGKISVSGAPDGFFITRDVRVQLMLRDPDTNTWVYVTVPQNLDSTGAYSFTGLKPDNYRVAAYYTYSPPFPEARSGVIMSTENSHLTYSTTLVIRTPSIAEVYASLGGASGALGPATSGVGTYPESIGYYGGGSLQHFANGTIYSSTQSGTHVVWAGPIREAYWAAGSIFGNEVATYGWPISDQDCTSGTCSQDFMGGTITPKVLSVTQLPVVSGATIAGAPLTASTGTYSPTATSFKYQWKRDGATIPGAIGSTYVPTGSDVGHVLRVDVTATAPGSLPTTVSSAPTAAIGPSTATQIGTLYASLGGASGQLGASTSSIVGFPDNGGGSLQHFTNGSIYASNAYGAFVVWAGPIRDAYWAASSIFGTYKWPTGAQDCTTIADTCSQQFMGGPISARPLVATTAPTVTGGTRVGGTLVASNGVYSPAATSFSYRWLRDGAAIAGATASSYVPTAADATHTLQVEVKANRVGSVSVVALSSPTAAISPSAATLIANLYASNVAQLGAATSGVAAFPDSGGGSLQHFANGSIYSSAYGTFIVWAGPIRDAYWAASSIFGIYKWPTGAQVCAAGTCSQTFVGPTISAAPLTVTTAPAIGGTARVGATLIANAGSYSPAATSLKYQWVRDDGLRIPGATSSTYVPTSADATHTLQVEVTASRTGSVSTVALSTPSAPIGLSAAQQIAALYATMSVQLGAATSGAVAFPDNGGGSLQHFVNGSIYSSNVGGTWAVVGQIRDMYWGASSIFGIYKWPTGAQDCTTIPGTCSQQFMGGPISLAPLAVTTAPAITGTAQVGLPLVTSTGVYFPAATSYSYAWLRDGTRIAGATGATYVPVASDQTHTLQAEVTASKGGWVSAVTLTSPTLAVAPSAASQITALANSLVGSASLGPATSPAVAFPNNGGGVLQHFTSGSIYSSPAGTFVVSGQIRDVYWAASSIFGSYKWPSSAADCSTGTCIQQFTGGPISLAPPTIVTAPSISGPLQVGLALVANPGTYSSPVTVRYQWIRNGTVRIAGAASATYVPVDADAGQTLQVEVTASAVGPALVTVSAATTAVAASAASQITALAGSLVGTPNALGSPTTGAVYFPDNGGGTLQHFQNGSIYSSPAGTYVVSGTVRAAYWAASSIFGVYKWPSSAADCVTTPGTCVQQFTGTAPNNTITR